jgi:hypothetical protein
MMVIFEVSPCDIFKLKAETLLDFRFQFSDSILCKFVIFIL